MTAEATEMRVCACVHRRDTRGWVLRMRSLVHVSLYQQILPQALGS